MTRNLAVLVKSGPAVWPVPISRIGIRPSIGCVLEAVHVERPLQGDDRALHHRQEDEREHQGEDDPDRNLQREGWGPDPFHHEHQRDQEFADDENREIGRRIVGAVVMKFFAALRTLVRDLQIAPEQSLAAAIRAAQAGTQKHGGERASAWRLISGEAFHRQNQHTGWPVGSRTRYARQVVATGHDRRRPRVRLVPFRGAPRGERRTRRDGTFSVRPVLSISKRNPPAIGVTSLSRTRTLSPSL